jgi:hypothetical protein
MTDGIEPVFPATGATQEAGLPPLAPEQVHVHGPLPLTDPVIPEEHNPFCGFARVAAPLAAPQAPSSGAGGSKGAVQLVVMPPFSPEQLQFHGPLPTTPERTPEAQRLSVGWADVVLPFADPHRPLTATPGGLGGMILLAEHEPTPPPLLPEHDHAHGPSPLTALAVPLLHKPSTGMSFRLVPSAEPHAPSTLLDLVCKDAAQLTSTPPPLPPQVHCHGPSP